MRWQREDAVYAGAAAVATALVVYFTIGNFGLVPTPLAPGRSEAARSIGVPSLGSVGTSGAPNAVQGPAAVPRFPATPGRAPAAGGSETGRPAPAADRTRPGTRITTAEGTQLTVTEPAAVTGTATDTGSGIRAVDVTFARATGGEPTVVPARLFCNVQRTRCTWSADVPGTAGRYEITAAAIDRASNKAESRSVGITVVDGGGAVTAVTGGAGGVVGNIVETPGGVLGRR